jgi:hypothetical protein
MITKKDCLVAILQDHYLKKFWQEYRKSSFYPLQTFSKSKELEYSKIPFFIEAENEQDKKFF